MYALDTVITLIEPFLYRNSLKEIGIREHKSTKHKQDINLYGLIRFKDSAFGSKVASYPIIA